MRKVTSEHILCKCPPFLVEECGSRPDYQSVTCYLTILDSDLLTLDPWLRTYVVFGDKSWVTRDSNLIGSEWYLCGFKPWKIRMSILDALIIQCMVYWWYWCLLTCCLACNPYIECPQSKAWILASWVGVPKIIQAPGLWGKSVVKKDILWMEEILHHLGW